MNTESLLNYTRDGNPPRAGIHPRWSSHRVLSKVLGFRGALGPKGPLGERGVIGDHAWNPSYWWTKYLELNIWDHAPDHIFEIAGPLSDRGVLSDRGPIAKDWGEGAYSVLGTVGPLGPLGPLGPVGLMGALGSLKLAGPDTDGVYHNQDTGQVVRDINIKNRRVEIFERYSRTHADTLSARGELDTSFMIDSILNQWEWHNTFHLQASADQLVTALVIPEKGIMANMLGLPQKLNFSIQVTSATGQLIAHANEPLHMNFVQIVVPKGEKFSVAVKRQGMSLRPQHYRLIVVGADKDLFDHFPDVIQGSHTINPYSKFQEFLQDLGETTKKNDHLNK